MAITFFLAMCAGAEGQIGPLLWAGVGASVLSGAYSFMGMPQFAPTDAMQSSGAQVALTGLVGMNTLFNPSAGFCSLLLTMIMGLEAYTGGTVWWAQNQHRVLSSGAATGLLQGQKGGDDDDFASR